MDPLTNTPPPVIPPQDSGLQVFTAATVVTLSTDKERRKDKELGSVFLRDTGLLRAADFYAVEQLIGVGGTKKFSNATVSMEITGYEFAGALVTGTVCR